MIRRSLPFDAWPEPDRTAWTEAIAEGDIFNGRGPAAHWAATTRYTVMAAYGRYLAFLAESEPLVLADHPTKRLTEDRFARYLAHIAETAGTMGRHMFLAKLRDAVRVMFPGSVPQHLSRLVARLEGECRPRSKAVRIVSSTRLAALGAKLMEGATGVDGETTDPVGYRDGLMIALLAQRPLRLRTFSLIQVGTHLQQVGQEWRMVFEGPESKSGRAFEITVPENLVPFFDYYLREVRPKFTGAGRHDGLWTNTKGGPLTANAIARVITERTRQAFGQALSPHLFRHCAATTIAILQPAGSASRETFLGMPRWLQRTLTTIRRAQSRQAGCMLGCLLNLLLGRSADSRNGLLPPATRAGVRDIGPWQSGKESSHSVLLRSNWPQELPVRRFRSRRRRDAAIYSLSETASSMVSTRTTS